MLSPNYSELCSVPVQGIGHACRWCLPSDSCALCTVACDAPRLPQEDHINCCSTSSPSRQASSWTLNKFAAILWQGGEPGMASKDHHKRILAASGVSKGKPGGIIRGFERNPILLKPRNKSHGVPLDLLPIVRKLDGKRIQRPWPAIILVFAAVILFKVQFFSSPEVIADRLHYRKYNTST